jgi:uncharacterized protein (DUF3820 family)
MSDYILRFGIHKDSSIKDLLGDAKYLLWLRKQQWINNELREAIDLVFDDIIMNFGKYNGKTIREIKSLNNKYIEWLMREESSSSVESHAE